MENKESLVAICGIYCGICPVYQCKDNPQMQEAFIARGMRRESVPCKGCKPGQGDCPVLGAECETYKCATQRGVEFCIECTDFPCSRLNPAADRADILPHNTKVFNLCFMKHQGMEKFIAEAPKIQARYYKGKMVVGKGPQLD